MGQAVNDGLGDELDFDVAVGKRRGASFLGQDERFVFSDAGFVLINDHHVGIHWHESRHVDNLGLEAAARGIFFDALHSLKHSQQRQIHSFFDSRYRGGEV